MEVWVLAELEVFESLTGGFVEDGKGPLLEKGIEICAADGTMG